MYRYGQSETAELLLGQVFDLVVEAPLHVLESVVARHVAVVQLGHSKQSLPFSLFNSLPIRSLVTESETLGPGESGAHPVPTAAGRVVSSLCRTELHIGGRLQRASVRFEIHGL